MEKERSARLKRDQRLKEREKKEGDLTSRKHLMNVRVVQKNLVYVIGMAPEVSSTQDLISLLKSPEYFGQYGKVQKIVVNKLKNQSNTNPGVSPNLGIYVTYGTKEEAQRAMEAIDGSLNEGRVLRASYGTTKYCTAYLRNIPCQNPNCMYLHEAGNDQDSYSREDMSTFQHTAKHQAAVALGREEFMSLPSSNSRHQDLQEVNINDNTPSLPTSATASPAPTLSMMAKPSAWGKPSIMPTKPVPINPLIGASSLVPGSDQYVPQPGVWGMNAAATVSASASPKSVPLDMGRSHSSTPSLSSNTSTSIGSRQSFFDRTMEVLMKGPVKFQFSKAFMASDDFKAAKEIAPLFTFRKELSSNAQK